MKIFLRSLILAVLRFFCLIVLLIFVQNFEVGPLPDWTLIAFTYLMDFLVTYLFARWATRKCRLDWLKVSIVAAVFIVGQILLEIGLQYFINPKTTTIQSMIASYSWQSLAVIGVYLLAVYAAGWRKIKLNQKSTIAEGMAS